MSLFWRSGFADAVMGRPSESPWRDFYKQQQYVKGYIYGKGKCVDTTGQAHGGNASPALLHAAGS